MDPAPSNPGVSVNGNGLCTNGLWGLVANSANSVSLFTSGGTGLAPSSFFSSLEGAGGSITNAGGIGLDGLRFGTGGGSRTKEKQTTFKS